LLTAKFVILFLVIEIGTLKQMCFFSEFYVMIMMMCNDLMCS